MKILSFTNLKSLYSSNFLGFGFSIILIIVGSVLIWLNKDLFPLSVPLWFSREWGEGRLAAPTLLWLFPSIGFLITLINFLITAYLTKNNSTLADTVVWSNLIVSVILFISLLQIILVST